MKKLFAVTIAVLLISAASVLADVPHMINYQGHLTDTGGEPLDTTVAMTFSFYDAATLGTLLWSESHPSITVQAGLFDTLLGSVNAIPDSVFDSTSVWLGITVGTDSEMDPRTRVGAVPYALRSGTDSDWTISGNDMYSGVSGNVGIGTSSPDSSAILDVSSTTQGFLPPRMTETQRVSISSPATGLLVFQTDGTSGLYYYNGSAWESFATGKHYIGESYGGGIVFWVDETGKHGLVAATSDHSTTIRWRAGTNGHTRAYGNGIGAGEMNTAIIIAAHITIGDDGNTYAARVCADLKSSNYGDWYLPSKHELNQMYLQKTTIGGFVSDYYWSSLEEDIDEAWIQHFGPGTKATTLKQYNRHVRSIRAF